MLMITAASHQQHKVGAIYIDSPAQRITNDTLNLLFYFDKPFNRHHLFSFPAVLRRVFHLVHFFEGVGLVIFGATTLPSCILFTGGWDTFAGTTLPSLIFTLLLLIITSVILFSFWLRLWWRRP